MKNSFRDVFSIGYLSKIVNIRFDESLGYWHKIELPYLLITTESFGPVDALCINVVKSEMVSGSLTLRFLDLFPSFNLISDNFQSVSNTI